MSKQDEFKFEELHGPHVEKFLKANRQTYTDGIIRVWPSGCTLTYDFRNHARRIRNLTVYPDDVWIVTHPKCGTTWTLEMVWLLINNLDFAKARLIPQDSRTPFLEFGCRDPPTERAALNIGDTIKDVETLKSPRCIKTHLPLDLLPQQMWTVKPKIIYVAREPKDVAVSWYHHHRLINGYTGSCEDFVEAFMAGIVEWGPFWNHILAFWNLKDEPNILFNTYEEMQEDLPSVIVKTAAFLSCPTLEAEQIEELCQHLSFDSMSKNPSCVNHADLSVRKHKDVIGDVQPLIRKGKVGSWKTELLPQVGQKINQWTEEKLKNTSYPL